MRNLVERRTATELSASGLGREFGIGLLIGAGLYVACELVLMALGIYRIQGLNPWRFLLPAVAMAISSSVFEELLFRGVLYRSLEAWFGSWAALVVSALVFGLSHLANPQATLEGALFIAIEAGILLGAAVMLTRRLWLSIGFHMAWNYTQSAIFSGIVSGNDAEQGLIRSTVKGPRLPDRRPVRCRVVGAVAGPVHRDRDRDAGHGPPARPGGAASLEADGLSTGDRRPLTHRRLHSSQGTKREVACW